jgi:hypothetical protein
MLLSYIGYYKKDWGKTCPYLKIYYNTKFEYPDDSVAPPQKAIQLPNLYYGGN